MKKSLYILLVFLIGCTSKVDEGFILENKDELLRIFQESYKSDVDVYYAEDDNEISKRIKRIGIDQLEIKSTKNSIDFIGADSLAYFTIKSKAIWEPQKNIIYDFAKAPRNFGNAELVGASYYRIQIQDRWYYETIGFD